MRRFCKGYLVPFFFLTLLLIQPVYGEKVSREGALTYVHLHELGESGLRGFLLDSFGGREGLGPRPGYFHFDPPAGDQTDAIEWLDNFNGALQELSSLPPESKLQDAVAIAHRGTLDAICSYHHEEGSAIGLYALASIAATLEIVEALPCFAEILEHWFSDGERLSQVIAPREGHRVALNEVWWFLVSLTEREFQQSGSVERLQFSQPVLELAYGIFTNASEDPSPVKYYYAPLLDLAIQATRLRESNVHEYPLFAANLENGFLREGEQCRNFFVEALTTKKYPYDLRDLSNKLERMLKHP